MLPVTDAEIDAMLADPMSVEHTGDVMRRLLDQYAPISLSDLAEHVLGCTPEQLDMLFVVCGPRAVADYTSGEGGAVQVMPVDGTSGMPTEQRYRMHDIARAGRLVGTSQPAIAAELGISVWSMFDKRWAWGRAYQQCIAAGLL